MTKVCTYSRYRTLEARNEHWPEHHKLITDLLEQHRDWDNQMNFVDVESHSNDHGLTTKECIVSMAKEGKLQLLLIPSISMLGRNVNEVLSFVRELNNSGCMLYAIREGISPNEDELRQINMFAEIAESVEQKNQEELEAEYEPFKIEATSGRDVLDFVEGIDYEYEPNEDTDKIKISIGENEITLPMNEYNFNIILNALADIGNDFEMDEQTM